ncbi:MAG TPA: hypothetical protein VGN17_05010 [Bryobacteraceae bacterium]|jgi:hypothetical protein
MNTLETKVTDRVMPKALPAPTMSETLTLKKANKAEGWIFPWLQFGGCEIKDDVVLVVFSYWLVKITGKNLLALHTVFERRVQDVLEEGQRMDQFAETPKHKWQIAKIEARCLVQ